MNMVRTFVGVLLIVGVLAVTGLNTYTTRIHCDLFLAGVEFNNAEMARNKIVHDQQIIQAIKDKQIGELTFVAQSESDRASQAEASFNDLAQRFVRLRQAYNQASIDVYSLTELLKIAGQHIDECHRLLEANGINPPEFPGAAQECPEDRET